MVSRIEVLGASNPLLLRGFPDLMRAASRRTLENRDVAALERTGLERLAGGLRSARLALERLQRYDGASSLRRIAAREAGGAKAAIATSSAPLGLEAAQTPATLRSTEEVNTTPTSFTPWGPDWIGFGTSDAQASIGGTYLGTNGTGTLRFQVNKAGTHGDDDLEIDVYDPADVFIQRIDIDKNDPINQTYTLTNGLTLQLGAGDLVEDDEFFVDVDASLPPSFSPTDPVWQGVASDAAPIFAGVYDGSEGAGTFTFEVNKDGIHGEDDLKLDVFGPTGDKLQDIDIKKEDPLDQVYVLDSGITIQLGAGELLMDDAFTLEVSDTLGTVVDPANPFDGVGNADPRFDPGFSVGAGSFDVNGVGITVAASDSLNDVLARISASAAGVMATFDAAAERIVLTQKTPGSGPTISLANDTSGFLAATKLAAATVVPGTDGDPDVPIAQVPTLASVSSGTFQVNGVDITIDVDVDSLQDVLARITGSGTGATASFDVAEDRVSIRSDDPTQALVLSDPVTGFFDAVKIAPGTYDPTVSATRTERARVAFRERDRLERDLRDATRALNALFSDEFLGIDRSRVDELAANGADAIREALMARLDDTARPTLRTGLGLDFQLRSGASIELEFDVLDFRRVVNEDADELYELLFGGLDAPPSEPAGLIAALDAVFAKSQRSVEFALGRLPRGQLVDLRA